MGHYQMEIAKFIGVDKSTISRELKRNQGQRGYRPKQAHNLAMNRRKQGVLHNEGGAIYSSAMGRLGCSAIITAIIPPSKVDSLLDSLLKTHNAGVRYPITSFFDFEGTFPPAYREQMKIWEKDGEQ